MVNQLIKTFQKSLLDANYQNCFAIEKTYSNGDVPACDIRIHQELVNIYSYFRHVRYIVFVLCTLSDNSLLIMPLAQKM